MGHVPNACRLNKMKEAKPVAADGGKDLRPKQQKDAPKPIPREVLDDNIIPVTNGVETTISVANDKTVPVKNGVEASIPAASDNIDPVKNGVEGTMGDNIIDDGVNVVVADSKESATDNDSSNNETKMVEESSVLLPNNKGSIYKPKSSDKIGCWVDEVDKEGEWKLVSHANNRVVAVD